MKRIIALLLALTLAAGLAAAETAQEAETPASFDVSYFENYDQFFLVDVSQDGESARILTMDPNEAHVFATAYQAEDVPSLIRPDITVLNYPREQERQAAFTIRIVYNGTKPLNIHSATFAGGGYEYTFRDIATGVAPESDGVCTETMAVVGGSGEDNARFLATLMGDAYEYVMKKYAGSEDVKLPGWTLVLHGDEDVAVELPEGFWTDAAMFTIAMLEMNAFSFLARNPGSPCEAVEMK